jgi:hypothetical protein
VPRFRHNTTYLIAALCLAAQALVLGHYVLVEHTRCAEHGELLHAVESAQAHRLGGASAADPNGDALRRGEVAHDEGHDHCATTSDRRKSLCASAVEGTPLRVDSLVRFYEHGIQIVDVDAAIYCVAPKTSPPV